MPHSDLILLLATAHSLVYLGALFVTPKPLITLFHGFLATSFIAYVLRPVIAVLAGGHILYRVDDVWTSYVLGLAVQLTFNVAFIVGYLLCWRAPRRYSVDKVPRSVQRGYAASLLIGAAVVAVIHVLSGGAWLPNVRSTTITSAVPYGKLLFPLAVIPLSVCLPLALLVWLRNPRLRLLVVFPTGLSLVLLFVLYQRGFVISGFVVAAFLFEKLRGLSYRHAIILFLGTLFF